MESLAIHGPAQAPATVRFLFLPARMISLRWKPGLSFPVGVEPVDWDFLGNTGA